MNRVLRTSFSTLALLLVLLSVLLSGSHASAFPANQPFASYWFPNELLVWMWQRRLDRRDITTVDQMGPRVPFVPVDRG